MKIHFWGVRGSLPAPLTAERVQAKITAVLDRIQSTDLKNADTKRRFLERLPDWIFGTTGANTSCVSVSFPEEPNSLVVFDSGSGIRELGATIQVPHYHLFFSHFHWDHLMGFPFFGPAYNPHVHLDLYSPEVEVSAILSAQMIYPFFPTPMEAMGGIRSFHHLSGDVTIGPATISFKQVNHPGVAYAYRVDDGAHRFLYMTDIELSTDDFANTEENKKFFSNIDVAVIDSQYTLDEALLKAHWGHSSFGLVVDFADRWDIKQVILFHHDPMYSDEKLAQNLRSAELYRDLLNRKKMILNLAIEGMEIIL
ncbi:MBL fold hydrolase [Spirochaetia bacterium]|nr:MBL fold hydrolase [Spirochaetia bacterium]GHU34065.1 MBL fold hydrolase [Spirochaetia bacterium]